MATRTCLNQTIKALCGPLPLGLMMLSRVALASDAGLDLGAEDKQAHIIATGAISLYSGVLLTGVTNDKSIGPVLGFGTAMAVGVAKELSDPYFSIGDIKADLLGSFLGALSARFLVIHL